MNVVEFIGNAAGVHPAAFPAPQLAFAAVLFMWAIGWMIYSSTDRPAAPPASTTAPTGARRGRGGDEHAGWDAHLDQLTALQAETECENGRDNIAARSLAGEASAPAAAALRVRGVVARDRVRVARHALSDRAPAPRLRPRMANARFAEHIAARSGAGR